MHWLSERMDELQVQYRDWEKVRGRTESAEVRKVRGALFQAMRSLVASIAQHPGVDAAFASHEGLLVEGVGCPQELEAAAAMIQQLRDPSQHALRTLGGGELQQVLVVGEQRKLVVLSVGELMLGLVAPTGVHLGESLSTPA